MSLLLTYNILPYLQVVSYLQTLFLFSLLYFSFIQDHHFILTETIILFCKFIQIYLPLLLLNQNSFSLMSHDDLYHITLLINHPFLLLLYDHWLNQFCFRREFWLCVFMHENSKNQPNFGRFQMLIHQYNHMILLLHLLFCKMIASEF